MRILFLHEVNYLRKPIFEMHEFPEYLAERKHKVGVVQFPEGESKESLKTHPWKQEIQGRVVKDTRLSLYTPKTNSGGLFGRLIAAARFGREFKRVLQDFNPDVVVSLAVPTSGWQALRVCKKARIPYLFRALDVSHKIRKSVFSGFILQAEKYIYRNADWVSANNPAMLDYCISLGAQVSTSSIELPPLNLAHFSAKPGWRAETRVKLRIPEEASVIIYIGTFFYFSGLPGLIKSFADNRMENQILVLVGGGEQEAELIALARKLDVDSSVLFTGFVSFDQLPRYLAVADVAVNPMLPSLVSNTALPNKVIQYMAASLPVVSTPLNGLSSTFREMPGLTFATNGSQFISAIEKFLSSKDRAGFGETNRLEVQEKFQAAVRVSELESRIMQLLGPQA
jgi:glycosyltransferase involved in cell wall biosynthesis